MIKLKFILLILISLIIFPEKQIEGKYIDHFGQSIEFLPNSKYKFYYQFDLAASWSNGEWKITNDTIYLKYVPVMDTLELRDSEKKFVKDSLVLSMDSEINRIDIEEYAISSLSAYGQNKIIPPKKLILMNGKLYRIKEDGSIETEKRKQFWTQKNKKTFFYKVD